MVRSTRYPDRLHPAGQAVAERLVEQFIGPSYDWLTQMLFGSIEVVQDAATRWLWTYSNEIANMALDGISPRQKLAR